MQHRTIQLMERPVYISHASAFEYWNAHRAAPDTRLDQLKLVTQSLDPSFIHCARITTLRDETPTNDRIRNVLNNALPELSLPVDILVSNNLARRSSPLKHCHIWDHQLVPGVFYSVGNDVYISSPEFMVIQMARSLSLTELIKLLFEVCGSYSLPLRQQREQSRCLPLTTVTNIRRIADKCQNIAGISKFRKALRSIADKAASPAESITIARLCTRRSEGGYGIPLPKMNHVIDLPDEIRELAHRKRIICDAYWPQAKFVLEYDGRIAHMGDANIEKDYARENALLAMGFQTMTITRHELYYPERFDNMATRIMKVLHTKARGKHGFDREWEYKRDRFCAEIMRPLDPWRS